MKNIPNKRKVEKAVSALRVKYGVEGYMMKADFQRICKGEGITVDEHSDVKAFFDKWKFLPGFCLSVLGGIIALRCMWDEAFEPTAAAYVLGLIYLDQGSGAVPGRTEYFDDPKTRQVGYFAELLTGEVLYA